MSLFKLRASNKVEYSNVDAEDYLDLYEYTWHVADDGYFVRKGKRNRNRHLHADILSIPREKATDVEHINGDIQDNRRSNLRIDGTAATDIIPGTHASEHEGVRRVEDDDTPWEAFYREGGDVVSLGRYETEREAAHEARDHRMRNYELTAERRSEHDTAYVYMLIDPRDGSVRYLGKSVNPKDRYKHHVKPSRRAHDTRKADWIQELHNEDYKPRLFVVEEVDDEVWEQREQWWLDNLKGEPLTNEQVGGAGQSEGRVRKQDVREKLRKWAAGESRGGSSKYPGVSWNEEKQAWCGFVTIRGKNHYVGQFNDELECARAVYERRCEEYDYDFEDEFEELIQEEV